MLFSARFARPTRLSLPSISYQHMLRAPLCFAWRMCLCLSLSLIGCGSPVQILPVNDPPPANLAQTCWAGPAWPEGRDVPFGEFYEIAVQREAAATECRAKHRALVTAWPK